ncbi:MAG: DUF2868 domain-containing protein [Pelomonas sp.]|nr:DUF2868 domain-containing protein [Roseateles sp.]
MNPSAVATSVPEARPPAAELDEAAARRVCLLRACEEGPVDEALWSPEDAAWASRLADESAGAQASDALWQAERARHAMQRLLPRRPALVRAAARHTWSSRWGWGALAVGGALGVLADLAGAGQRVNLLAAPVWGVVAWNVLVYATLGFAALRRLAGPARARPAGAVVGEARGADRADQAAEPGASGAGSLRRLLQRWLAGAPAGGAAASSRPEQRFAALWAQVSAPLAASRATLVLHVAAAALAAGLVAGLYARALVLDYRVTWQSTLLEPPQVHALLSVLLAPASATTGIAIPSPEAVAALRVDAAGAAVTPEGGAASPPATSATSPAAAAAPAAATAATAPNASRPSPTALRPAAAWLHLMAATVALAVVLPRLLLALAAAWQARRRARRVALPPPGVGTLALLQGRRRTGSDGRPGPLVVQVLPHGFAPPPAATLALRAVLAAALGEGLELRFAAAVPYGEEDHAPSAPPPGTSCRIAWFDLAATPEAQAQGRFVEQLAAAASLPLVLLVDESGYRQRMGAGSPRLAERRRAWQDFAAACGAGLASIDLEQAAARPAAAVAAVQAALRPATSWPR